MKKRFVKLLGGILAMAVLVGCGGTGTGTTVLPNGDPLVITATPTPGSPAVITATPTPAEVVANTQAPVPTTTKTPENGNISVNREILTGKTAVEVVANMGVGWNLGNTFDSTGGNLNNIVSFEKSWGNPEVTEEFIKAVKNAGFTTIRIPCTWGRAFTDKTNYVISQSYIDRVKEVVTWAYENDMYIILNIHHEDWLNNKDLVNNKEKIGKELKAVWTQIADNFAEFDQHLIFECMNEPRLAGTTAEWSGNAVSYGVINEYNQIVAETIRESKKGYNGERCIMIPGYAASSDGNIMRSIKIPQIDDKNLNNVIISVHCYSPYEFCLADSMKDFDPNKSSCTAGINAVFNNIKAYFLNKGIPVVIGETGATNTNNNTEARERWARYMGEKSKNFGVPIVIWDNGASGTSGGECHAWFNRAFKRLNYPSVVEALLDGYNSAEFKLTEDQLYLDNGAESASWKEALGVSNDGANWTEFLQIDSDPGFFSKNKIAIKYKGSGELILVLDSAIMEKWWMPVENVTKAIDGLYTVAYINISDIKKVLKSFDIEDYNDLRYINVVCKSGTVTVYEVYPAD